MIRADVCFAIGRSFTDQPLSPFAPRRGALANHYRPLELIGFQGQRPFAERRATMGECFATCSTLEKIPWGTLRFGSH